MRLLRRYVFHDIGLKVFSLVIAACLWAVVTQDQTAEISITVPIELQHVPANLEIGSRMAPKAELWLSGPSHVLDRLTQNSVKVSVDLSNAQPGDRTYTVRPLAAPDGVHVRQIEPAQVQIPLDVRQTRVVDVRPRVVGRLASGFAIRNVVAAPSQVTIVGPAKRVDAVDSAITDPVDATGLLSDRSFSTNAYVSDPLVQVVSPEPVRVTVFVSKSRRSSN